ncbi:hypothetical protein [Marinifilum flexuosum]|uniref:hypothetical protein n=1 Tax=Marinifilum flexuosum TaxID=1117708 RepID=UPI002491797F|nr:hypothetical protein [Marinifilum flexuosum]
MDEGWGNIIYLIILAIVGIFSSIKKNKKKPVPISPPDDGEIAEQSAPQTTKPQNDFESVFEALLGQQRPEPYHEEEEWETEAPIAEQEVVLDSVPEQKDPRESSIEYTKKRQISSLDALKDLYQEEAEEEEDDGEEIDWRQAIIYKEILERKYN